MIITGPEIHRRIKEGQITIDPFDEKQLNPASYDLRLGNTLKFYVPNRNGSLLEKYDLVLDSKKKNYTKEVEIPEDGFILKPGKIYLGQTLEWTEVSGNLLPKIRGKSSKSRLGIGVKKDGGFGDTGYRGHWTLCISVDQPVKIYPNQRICQIYYEMTYGPLVEYDGKYQDSKTAMPSIPYKED